ncbi:invasion associated locus B family protein [Camelimonas sp. ID_303_24]
MIRAGIVATAIFAATSAFAQTGSPLPGGASSLRETHGDWVVNCITPKDRKLCTVSQQLAQQSQGGGAQRVLSIELTPSAKGAEGALLLPFGLLVAKGAAVQVDDGKALAATPIRTCVPGGCIAPLTLDASTVASMRKGKQLKLNLFASDTEKPFALNVSLKGFGDALDRASALLK